ncbi:MAG: hypothetical protein V1833_06890 [Elusimicrobiota bacterium]
MCEYLFNSNTYHYFFSTISQTFGAILGIVGMLIIFIIQNTKNSIESMIKKIRLNFGSTESQMMTTDISDYNIWLERAESNNAPHIKEFGKKLKLMIDLQNNILKKTNIFFWSMAILIIGALLMLPLANYFERNYILGVVLIITFIIGAILALCYTLKFLLKIILSNKL